MRNNLVVHFHCSECGRRLNISLEGNAKAKPTNQSKRAHYTEDIPKHDTGAHARELEPIQIEPCEFCIEKYTEPSRKLIEALNQIKEIK